ncbi:MAG TPA: DUF924 family protein [Rudaea sp.]|nr:DUF924 family protein [Rudaea sp.]
MLDASLPPDCRELLDFWFGDADGEAEIAARQSSLWWQADAERGREIGERFGSLREDAIAGRLASWTADPRSRLALIVLVDQFSRNLFRGDAQAFAHDGLAREWCATGLEQGMDAWLRPIERVFFYMPLEHAEDLDDQQKSVALFTALRDGVPDAQREAFANFLAFAKRHRAIVARFGRFPHRNAALGRTSTPEELMFLREPGSSF